MGEPVSKVSFLGRVQFQCGKCNSIRDYESKEIKYQQIHDSDHGQTYYHENYYYYCAFCRAQNLINSSDLVNIIPDTKIYQGKFVKRHTDFGFPPM
jgi:phage FluMu protein Com